MKIAILTFHNSFNCGAVLQAWALQQVLGQSRVDVEFPNLKELREIPRVRFCSRGGLCLIREGLRCIRAFFLSLFAEDVARSACRSFRSRFMTCVKVGLNELATRYAVVIVGSDQVWNPHIASEERQRLFFGESLGGTKLVGYALSGGDDGCDNCSSGHLRRLKNACRRFCAVSGREQHFAKQLREISGCKVPVVLDPTLLLRVDDYEKVACQERLVQGDYLFVYSVSFSNEVLEVMRQVASELGVRLVFASPSRRIWSDALCKPEVVWRLSPDRFLAYIRDARYVVASSFHGTVFSIIYGKPFATLIKPTATSGRTMEVLRLVKSESRAVATGASPAEILAVLRQPESPVDLSAWECARADSFLYLNQYVFNGERYLQ